ncbi:hypothetical protein SB768_25295 [Burkholderia sp. SIMBA_043]|uniref:hypothetical protein n=1 Tax=Burkholderia TaxID=32008 RepID=UPI0005D79008|nr:hypothetical protein [Burkholderia vietnamiensis]AJY03119.1 putative membrane protein [Burkholderia vietnamiensis LMG 10929]MCA8270409.1 hypothetical protein [Burkholderia vietnamiensis]UBI29238.1 hypothetical protein LA325_31060 [Burkholderia vietnamiensis]
MGKSIVFLALSLTGCVLFVSGLVAHMAFIAALGLSLDQQVVVGIIFLVSALTLRFLSARREESRSHQD